MRFDFQVAILFGALLGFMGFLRAINYADSTRPIGTLICYPKRGGVVVYPGVQSQFGMGLWLSYDPAMGRITLTNMACDFQAF